MKSHIEMIRVSYHYLGNVKTLGQTRPTTAGQCWCSTGTCHHKGNSHSLSWTAPVPSLCIWHHIWERRECRAHFWELWEKQAPHPSEAFIQSTKAGSLIREQAILHGSWLRGLLDLVKSIPVCTCKHCCSPPRGKLHLVEISCKNHRIIIEW